MLKPAGFQLRINDYRCGFTVVSTLVVSYGVGACVRIAGMIGTRPKGVTGFACRIPNGIGTEGARQCLTLRLGEISKQSWIIFGYKRMNFVAMIGVSRDIDDVGV